MVWFHNVIQGATSGFVGAKNIALGDPGRTYVEIAFVVARTRLRSRSPLTRMPALEVTYPAVYLSILHLCESLANPLRASADVDFPRRAFSEYMLAENKAFFDAGSDPPFDRTSPRNCTFASGADLV